MLDECATTLDVQPVPELYIEQDPAPQAMAIGLDKPIIVINWNARACRRRGIAIHHRARGRARRSGAVYRTMLLALINLAAAMAWLPIGAWSIRAIILGLNEWFRKSELSCDRAGLLCSQDAGTQRYEYTQVWLVPGTPTTWI